MTDLPVVLAFVSGIASAVNPCGFALLPAFVSYFLGEGGAEAAGGGTARRLGRAVVVAGLVTAGFVVVFGTLGAAISLGSRSLVRWVPWIALAVGVGLVVAGAAILAGRSISAAVHPVGPSGGRSNRAMVVYGVGYGLASAGCTLPVFLVVVGAALAAGGALGGVAVFAAYALGMGAVLLAVTVGTALGRRAVVMALRRLLPHLEVVSGVGLLAAGGWLVYREMAFLRFTGWI